MSVKQALSILSILAFGSMAHTYIENFEHVKFDESMGNISKIRWGYAGSQDKQWHKDLKAHYERYNPSKVVPSEEPRIPKIIHQVYFDAPVPKKYKKWQESWKKFHPDWEYKLWTRDNVKDLTLQNQELFDSLTNHAQKTDILRLELLNQFGGIYADIDYECFKSFDLLNHCYDFYVGITNENVFTLINAFMASAPGHPAIKACVDNIELRHDKVNAIQNLLFTAGPPYITQVIMDYYYTHPNEHFMAFPRSYLYPYPYAERNTPPYGFIKPESYGVHYWEGSWIK